MIISEVPPDSPTTSDPPSRQFFANQPPTPRPHIIEEVPNNATRKTLAELFASYPNPGQPSQPSQPAMNTTPHLPFQNGPVWTHNQPDQGSISTNTAHPTPPNGPMSSYNHIQHNGPPPRLWFPPRPPGQDIDGNTSIPDSPWTLITPEPPSATMIDAPRTPVTPVAPRRHSVSMPDRPRAPRVKNFLSDIVSSAIVVPSEPHKPTIPKPTIPKPITQSLRRRSGANSHFPHPNTENPSTHRVLFTAPVLPNPPTSVLEYFNPFPPRPLTLPPRGPIPPKSSPENVSPRTLTASAPECPIAPFPDLNRQSFYVPSTVHALDEWPCGPLLNNMSLCTRRFAVGGTDPDSDDMKIYRPQLDRNTYLECLPPATHVEARCENRVCRLVCELDGLTEACRRRSALAKDAARWEPKMWACEGCGEEMEVEVLKPSGGDSPMGTGDAYDKKDERDG